MQIKNKSIFFSSTLVAVAAFWGISFVAMKNTLVRIDVISFLGWRFLIASLILFAIRPKFYKKLQIKQVIKGVICGILLGLGFITQSVGLTSTSVSKTSFITGLYVIFTPIISWIFFKNKINRLQWFAVLLATIALILLSFNGLSIGVGESYVLLSALLFAMHITALGLWAKDIDVYGLTLIQLITCTVLMFITAIFTGLHTPPDLGVLSAVIFTAVFATALAFIIQTLAQSKMSPTAVAVILTMEVPFAAIFAIIFINEALTLKILLGGVLAIISIYLVILADRNIPKEMIPKLEG